MKEEIIQITDTKKINRRTIKNLPQRDWDCESTYKFILLVPTGTKHDSGFMHIAIIGVKEDGTFEVAGYPDDVNWDFTEFNQDYSATGMRTDCYYPSGVLKFWGNGVRFVVGCALSSTDIKVTHYQN